MELVHCQWSSLPDSHLHKLSLNNRPQTGLLTHNVRIPDGPVHRDKEMGKIDNVPDLSDGLYDRLKI